MATPWTEEDKEYFTPLPPRLKKNRWHLFVRRRENASTTNLTEKKESSLINGVFKNFATFWGHAYGKRRKSYDSFQSQNSDFDYDSYLAFDLKEISTADGFARLRSKRKDAQRPIP